MSRTSPLDSARGDPELVEGSSSLRFRYSTRTPSDVTAVAVEQHSHTRGSTGNSVVCFSAPLNMAERRVMFAMPPIPPGAACPARPGSGDIVWKAHQHFADGS